ncbi:hypothetical protein L204_100872 [Cryptococcus depauperatus]|nr:lipase [Cryptococcus depauperatus CBS 7855]
MFIPSPLKLSSLFLPFIHSSQQDSKSLTFKPIHAHTHTFSPDSFQSTLFLHDSNPVTSFCAHDYPIEAFGGETNIPQLNKDGSLQIRTQKKLIRRSRIRPPTITSWAYSHHAQVQSLSSKRLNSTLALSQWSAPDYNDPLGGWEDIEVTVPDMSDRQTVIALAKMTSNAYVLPNDDGWYGLSKFNSTIPFGWEPDADGLRGHIFADEKNETVIISVKGTSAGLLGSGGPTAKNDKFNDNLLFSCCCARIDFSWSTVCDCYSGDNKCGQTCLEDALVSESVYATVGTNLYNNITYMYPNASIWLTGHSLGGSVSALIALSFGAPAVTFEAPGDFLPASRLHLPLPPGMPSNLSGITHVYHTADPIPMGVCNGAYSGCYAAGFAMESKCHTGETILYDTVKVKGWSVDVRTHRIAEVIDKVLAEPWEDEELRNEEKGREISKVVTNNFGRIISYLSRVASQWRRIIHQWGGVHSLIEQNYQVSSWGWRRRGHKKRPGNGKDEDDDWKQHGGVPKPMPEEDCVDCFKWEFGDWDQK